MLAIFQRLQSEGIRQAYVQQRASVLGFANSVGSEKKAFIAKVALGIAISSALAVGSLLSRRQRALIREILRTVLYALKSKSLRNMILAAIVLTGIARQIGLGTSPKTLLPIFFAVVWGLYYRFRVIEHGQCRFQRSFWNVQIVEKARLTKEPFHPVFWAYNAHAQTILCFVLTHVERLWTKKPTLRREVVEGFDGNPQYLDWYNTKRKKDLDPDSPIILMIHGVGDDVNHPYMRRFAGVCRAHGWRAVAFSYWRFDFGETRDLQAVIEHLAHEFPRAPIIAVAWSAGGYMLMNYLGQSGKNTPLVAAVIRGGCFDFVQAIQDIKRNENTAYRFFLTMQTKECARRHLAVDKHITPETKLATETLMSRSKYLEPLELYDRFIHEVGRYTHRDEDLASEPYAFLQNTASHYKHNAFSKIDHVKVSTLVVYARDDPVVSEAHVDWERIARNKHIITLRTKRGGHVAWYEGLFPVGPTYDDRVTTNFISAVLESHAQTNFLVDVLRRAMRDDSPSRDVDGPMSAGTTSLPPASMARICSASDLLHQWK